MTNLKIINWNTQGDLDSIPKRNELCTMFTSLDADIICLTEAYREYLPTDGHIIEGELSGWKYDQNGGRKVFLWSKFNWENIDAVGDAHLPPGRFLSAYLPKFDLKLIGVCIPWFQYRNQDITRNWEGHKLYTKYLAKILQNEH